MEFFASLLTCGQCIAPLEWKTKNIPTPYRLYFIKGGSAFFRIGNEEFELKKDHFYFFPSSLPFLIRQDPENRLNHIFYNFLISSAVVSAKPIFSSADSHPLFPHFLEIMENTVNQYILTKSPEAKNIACKVLEAFLSLFFSVNEVTNSKSDDIVKSIEYMETNYNKNITIKEIADSLYISEDCLIRKFKKAIGITPYSYLLKLRLSIARELINNGVSLTDTAEAIGFKHPSSLCHALKKQG